MGFIMIAPYISRAEYQCRHCDPLPPDFTAHTHPMAHSMLFESFEIIREAYGKPIPISSGYRCPLHNSFIGGSYLSAHVFGMALDLSTKSDTDYVFEIIERELPDLRIGKYVDFLHMDLAYLINPRASEMWTKGKRWSG